MKTVFVAEMLLSPVLAAIALIVRLAENWGIYGYLPALLWLALFVQCLISFRWRGLWFLLGPPVAVLGIIAFLTAAPPRAKLAPPTLSVTLPDLGTLGHGVIIGIGRP